MAQLIHDLAPGASILFATANPGQANFAANIRALAAAGAKVIVDDVGYFAEPTFQNGVIAQAINEVVAQGVTYFSSAGNKGVAGYEAPWSAGGSFAFGGKTETLMHFSTGQDYLPVTITGNEYLIFQWDQPSASAGGSSNQIDLDIFVTNQDGSVVYASDTANEIGGEATVVFDSGSARTAYLRIGLASGSSSAPTEIKVTSTDSGTVIGAFATNPSSATMVGHKGAQGNIPVAATAYYLTPAEGTNPPQVDSYSSGGPVSLYFDDQGNRLSTPLTRSNPPITAVDGGNTTFFVSDDSHDSDTFPNFYGTSAAAPDAAAVALLMLQARGSLAPFTPDDIKNLMMDSAIDMDDPKVSGFQTGVDARTGAGLIQADKAVGFASTLNIAATAAHPVMLGTHFADTFSGGAENDTFTGNGASDTLIFAPSGHADTFKDFVAGAGGDIVDLTAFTNITSLQAVLNRASQPGADTIIDLGNGDTITLTGVTKGNLTTANFVLAPDHAPVITSDSGGATATLTIPENTTAVTSVAATDQDEATTLSYAIVSGADQGKFNIDGATGALSFLTAPDFEAPTDADQNNTYIVQVRASDGTLSDDQTITVNVTNVNDNAPVAKNDDFTTNEATAIGNVLSIFNNNGHGPDTDPDNSAFSVSAVNGSAATVGTTVMLTSGALLTVNADGTFNYDPNHAFDLLPAAGSGATNLTATDTFTYTTTDGSFTSNTATATVTVSGLDSVDLLQGSFSAGTTLAGGNFDDTYVVHNTDTTINDVSGTTDVVYVEGVSYSLAASASGVEAMIVEHGTGITGTGYSAAASTLFSQSVSGESITLIGGSAADYLSGGLGTDSLQGGGGDDLYVVHAAGTTISDTGGAVDIAYVEGVDFSLANGDGVDYAILENGTGHTLTGHTAESTTLYSVDMAGQSNTLIGGSAADVLFGSLGADNLQGGDGSDTYVTYSAGTTITDTGGAADVVYAENLNWTLTDGDGIENLILEGDGHTATGHATEATSIYSTGTGNTLVGGSAQDSLVAGAHGDALVGNGGNDFLIGGAGSDVFQFGTSFGQDVVYNFHPHDGGSNQDTIRLTGEPAGTTFASMVAANQIFEWPDASQSSGTDVIVEHDANNYVVLLNHHLADLSAADFLFS